eukprot:TRINITY_DN1728_c1_g2_i2.p1 TRINITY_DN1728_c1_g2~~TRINITY_DN1728_c1_g2_i2.p1  ORF type:complete len:252 (+),score=34.42 TRINITY_DN1728_c1_g2_i2:69-758(+)
MTTTTTTTTTSLSLSRSKSSLATRGNSSSAFLELEELKAVTVDRSKHPSGIIPIINNVICTVNLAVPVELRQISRLCKNTIYNPQVSAAAKMKLRSPSATASIYAKGTLVCSGTRSVRTAKVASRRIAAIVKRSGFPVRFRDFKVVNIFAQCDVGFPVHLEAIAVAHARYSLFNSEISSSLSYWMLNPAVTISVSASGRVSLAGAKNRAEVYYAFESFYPVLEEHRRYY